MLAMRIKVRTRRLPDAVVVLAVILFALTFCHRMQAQVESVPPRGPIPLTYFGLIVHHLWQDPVNHGWNEADWPTVPFGSWRLWDAHVLWAYLEPARGKYDFSILDKYVEDAQKRNVQPVLTLEGTPAWASARPNEIPMHAGGVKGLPGAAAESRSSVDWEDFVRTVAERYKGKIKYYEIWNEPMSEPYYSGSPKTMVSLVQEAATVLKQVDPEIKVLSPPVTGDPKGLDWLRSFLSAGGGQFIDIYGFHFYVGAPFEKAIPKVQHARELLRTFGQDSKPIWNTETGWVLKGMDPESASDYVARFLLLGWPMGLGRNFLYSWDHDTMGIAPNGHPNAPVVQAYATVARWLVGSVMTRCIAEPNGLWVENLTLPNGAQGKVVWSTSGTIRLNKDHIGAADQYETIEAQAFPIPSNSNLEVSASPILLYSGGKAY